MRLIKLVVESYRRFSDKQSLDLNENLIALVGPNEAGKSSILHALDMLGQGTLPSVSDTSRGQKKPASISGLFVLEESDRALLDNIHEGRLVTRVWINLKAGASNHTWTLEHRPSRDLSPRKRCLNALSKIKGDESLKEIFAAKATSNIYGWLESDEETLSKVTIDGLESLAEQLRGANSIVEDEDEDEDTEQLTDAQDSGAEEKEDAISALIALAKAERLATPARQVIDLLDEHLPEFACFGEEERNLQHSYNIAEVASDPPPALKNLCSLAGLDIEEVKLCLDEERGPDLEKMIENANKALKAQFQKVWTQSEVYPRLSTPSGDGILSVYVATEGDASYSRPKERSDGLRWFIALHAFLAARGATAPILLVDEAETHLHYDAQADLVDSLMRQKVASKVIYSTHSVGCLPPDLGCGIRAVLPEKNAERSKIFNSYWSIEPSADDRVGYAPLLFAMGARLLSLTIPRYGVIAEGPSDAILLPTLFREACCLKSLPYRVVPGLSELADDRVLNLNLHAGRIACLTDGDKSGSKIRQKLLRGGMPEGVLLSLGKIVPGCTLEDLVEPDIFAAAVNSELDTWGIGTLRIEASHLPPLGRWAWLQSEWDKNGTQVSRLNKVRVAQRLVDQSRIGDSSDDPRKIVLVDHLSGLRELHLAILVALGISAED